MQRHDFHELMKEFRMTFAHLLYGLFMFSPPGYWEIACSSKKRILLSGTELNALNFWQRFPLSPSTDYIAT